MRYGVRRTVFRSILSLMLGLSLLTAVASSAQAATWHNWKRWCGTFFTLVCDVQYTGSYPDGIVRGEGSISDYQIVLQTKVGHSGSWINVASTTTSAFTPSVKAGKDNYYQTCIRIVKGGKLNCDSPQGPIYLGDG